MHGTKIQPQTITEKDLEEGRKINLIFENLSEKGKIMATTYLSALRDKELSEGRAG